MCFKRTIDTNNSIQKTNSEDESDLEKIITSLMSNKQENANISSNSTSEGKNKIIPSPTRDNKHENAHTDENEYIPSPNVVSNSSQQQTSALTNTSTSQKSSQSTQSSITQTESPRTTSSSSNTSLLLEDSSKTTHSTKEQEIQTDLLLRASLNNFSLPKTKELTTVSTNTSIDVKTLNPSFTIIPEKSLNNHNESRNLITQELLNTNTSQSSTINASSLKEINGEDHEDDEFNSSIMCGLDMLKSFDLSEFNKNQSTLSQHSSRVDFPFRNRQEKSMIMSNSGNKNHGESSSYFHTPSFEPQANQSNLSIQSQKPENFASNASSFNHFPSQSSSRENNLPQNSKDDALQVSKERPNAEVEQEISQLKLELARAEEAYLKRKKVGLRICSQFFKFTSSST